MDILYYFKTAILAPGFWNKARRNVQNQRDTCFFASTLFIFFKKGTATGSIKKEGSTTQQTD